jgi:hypothetical protein
LAQRFCGSCQQRGFIQAGLGWAYCTMKLGMATRKDDDSTPVGGENLGGTLREIFQEVG